MAQFDAGKQISIEDQKLKFAAHPAAPKYVYGQEGRKGTVYKVLSEGIGKKPYALKVFKQAFRDANMVQLAASLARYADLPGLEVCRRKVLQPGAYGKSAVKKYPDLEYAVLMPWCEGRTWYDIVSNATEISPQVCVEIARRTASILVSLEEKGLAHCDIASGNLMIDIDTLDITLIDVEDMYAPDLPPLRENAVPRGSDGYNHRQARNKGQWNANADRFAGAIIIVEMLCWGDPQIREIAFGDGSFFDANEIHDLDSYRYQQLQQTVSQLTTIPSKAASSLTELLEQAWLSSCLDNCPKMIQWHNALGTAPRVPVGTKLTDAPIKWTFTGPITPNPQRSPIVPGKETRLGLPDGLIERIRAPRLIPVSRIYPAEPLIVRWLGVQRATLYQLWESESSEFNDAQQVFEGPETFVDLTAHSPGTFYYRVRALNEKEIGHWSEVQAVSF